MGKRLVSKLQKQLAVIRNSITITGTKERRLYAQKVQTAFLDIDSISTPTPENVDMYKWNVPLVYVLKDVNNTPLYVGKSSRGISRILNNGSLHDRQDTRKAAVNLACTVDIYWCDSTSHMNKLEGKLMIQLQAPYNKVQLDRAATIGGILNPHWIEISNRKKDKRNW